MVLQVQLVLEVLLSLVVQVILHFQFLPLVQLHPQALLVQLFHWGQLVQQALLRLFLLVLLFLLVVH